MEESMMEKVTKFYKLSRLENKERYKELSKQRLAKISKKKLLTSLIGSIAIFEKHFGIAWGHLNKNPTEQQLLCRKLWDLCRNEILTHGNNQLRALQKELEEYEISWNRHSIILKEKKDGE